MRLVAGTNDDTTAYQATTWEAKFRGELQKRQYAICDDPPAQLIYLELGRAPRQLIAHNPTRDR